MADRHLYIVYTGKKLHLRQGDGGTWFLVSGAPGGVFQQSIKDIGQPGKPPDVRHVAGIPLDDAAIRDLKDRMETEARARTLKDHHAPEVTPQQVLDEELASGRMTFFVTRRDPRREAAEMAKALGRSRRRERDRIRNEARPDRQSLREPIPAQLRFRVLQRDGFRCQYCGRSAADGAALHLDHVVPVADGGETSADNLLTACDQCNLGKGTSPVV